MELKSLLAGRVLWRAAEKLERRSGLWFNRPLHISGTWRRAFVVDVNERIVEAPFVYGRLQGTTILVVGSCESILPLELASLGYEVSALDLRDYPLPHPRLTRVKEDIRTTSLRSDFFDTAIAISTIEHVGLGFYGDPVDPHGDAKATAEIRRLLKPGGRLLLTVPFGKAATTPGHRVYDTARVRAVAAGFQIDEFLCYMRAAPGCWGPASVHQAERADSTSVVHSVALLSLRKPG